MLDENFNPLPTPWIKFRLNLQFNYIDFLQIRFKGGSTSNTSCISTRGTGIHHWNHFKTEDDWSRYSLESLPYSRTESWCLLGRGFPTSMYKGTSRKMFCCYLRNTNFGEHGVVGWNWVEWVEFGREWWTRFGRIFQRNLHKRFLNVFS